MGLQCTALTMNRTILTVLSGFVGLFIVLIFRALTFGPSRIDAPDCTPVDADFIAADPGVVERFRSGLQMKTVSWSINEQEFTELDKLRAFILKSMSLDFIQIQ